MVEFSRSGQEKQNKAASGEEKLERWKMKFTGTLIEDLIATVERAERRAQSAGALRGEPLIVESWLIEPSVAESWFASVQKNRDYNSRFLGVT